MARARASNWCIGRLDKSPRRIARASVGVGRTFWARFGNARSNTPAHPAAERRPALGRSPDGAGRGRPHHVRRRRVGDRRVTYIKVIEDFSASEKRQLLHDTAAATYKLCEPQIMSTCY